ncbi:MAG TPA: 2-amino-4-hydroxy-6-hydroxymethyldihydropteridine diphosphokinase [Deltaproteobacteria bacterium]|nr:2-amino-4-hydroxy-6-hydroxymethyldihydropteridine diphosphokinase [Deltaproteobacteria bacterium]
MPQRVLISIGSNLTRRIRRCKDAIEKLGEEEGIEVVRCSSFYETSPWGRKGQPDFINAAAQLETELAPFELLGVLKNIEVELGREEGERWGPRVIDLDIILWEDKIIDNRELKIPHPQMHRRKFVLIPLCEIAPEWVHPVMGKTVKELLKECDDTEEVRKVSGHDT